MIYIEPKAGLCNRMRAIESAYQIAKDLNTELCIVWLCNIDCMARFSELYCEIPGVEVIEIPALLGVRTTVRFHKLKTRQIMKQCAVVKELGLCQDAEEIRELVRDRDVYIQSCGVWYPYENHLDLFKPVVKIQQDIDRKKNEFSKYCVGAHIRRTDNLGAIKNSSTEKFIKYMENEIDNNPNVTFFVASDSREEKNTLKELFGSRIITNENIDLRRSSFKGMENAVKDLFLLASCEKILGSAESSYSEMAAEIGNIKCCVVK